MTSFNKVSLQALKKVWGVIFAVSFLLISFGFLLVGNSGTYYAYIVNVVYYVPLAAECLPTVAACLALSMWGVFKLKVHGRRTPPLMLTLALTFNMIGVFFSVALIMQMLGAEAADGAENGGWDFQLVWLLFPFMYTVTAISAMTKIVISEEIPIPGIRYKNKSLEALNKSLDKSYLQPVWALVLLVLVLLFIAVIFMLFGEGTDALFKSFSDTCTYYFSQRTACELPAT
jgi:hypothetical protein